MGKKKGKKRSDPEQSREQQPIPGLSSAQPPAVASQGASGQRPVSAPKQTQRSVPERSREQPSIPGLSSPPPVQPPAAASQGASGQRPVSAPKQTQRTGPVQSRKNASEIPAQSGSASSSREQPSAADRGRTQEADPVQLPKFKQPDSGAPGKCDDVPEKPSARADPSSSGEQPSPPQLNIPFKNMALVAALPRKPKQPGKLGRPIALISNCYPLRFDGCLVYHYDIEVMRKGANYTTPDTGSATDSSKNKDARKKYRCLNTRLNRLVFRRLCDEHFAGSFAVYDGEKNVYCMKKLPVGDEATFDVRIPAENPGDPDDPRGARMDVFQVIVKPVRKKETGDNTIDLEPLNALFRRKTTTVPLDAIMVLETVLRYVPCLRYVPVGRNFFSPPNEHYPLGDGKEIYFGHHQSIRLSMDAPVVNLDVSASSFYESIAVIQYVEKLLSCRLDRALHHDQIERIKKDMRNVCVETTHMAYRRKYRIDGLSDESANKKKLSGDSQVTIEQYYGNRYNLRLRYPHLPCLKVKNKDSFLPMEVCEIVSGQHSSKELNPKQQAEMIKYTAMNPRDRFGEIENIRRKADFDNNRYLRTFGLRVLDSPLKVDGRTMETPSVLLRCRSEEIRERPKFGSWNMRDKQFYTGTKISRWTLLSFADPDYCHFGKLKAFVGALQRFANEQGIAMEACSKIEMAEAKLPTVRDYIERMKDKFRAELIFIVLPTDRQRTPGRSEKLSQALYSEAKRIAETSLGIVTQCVKGENVVAKGTNPSFVSNLCLKMNAKMGGVNNSMIPSEMSVQPKEAILFVGADVNHPAPTEMTRYSLAAVVGNLDTHPSRYAVAVRAQANDENEKSMVEVILNMQEMMKKLLFAYYQTTRTKPKKIIVYRDGVSDGQFADVQAREIRFIKDACTSIEAGYKPGITFVVVQKRHHVRFLPERKMDNPPPGTVVDTTVTHPLNFDFFLYSHNGMKGTSRPSYYTVLADDNKFDFDTLEKMTYALCHTYVRCTKSISLPAPVQYADQAAYRARRHLDSRLREMDGRGQLVRGPDGKIRIPLSRVQEIINVQDCMQNTMYYV